MSRGPPPRVPGGGALGGVSPNGITGSRKTRVTRPKPGVARESALIDWCEFTIANVLSDCGGDVPPRVTPEWVISNILTMNPADFVTLPFGRNKYRRHMVCGDIKVFFDGPVLGMGVHVEFSGQGCRQFEQEHGGRGWYTLFHKIFDEGGNFTRVDLAIDDLYGQLCLRRMRRHMQRTNRQVVRQDGTLEYAPRVRSRFDKWKIHQEYKIRSSEPDGDGVTFGQRGSLVYVRFYDKALEKKQEGHWIRAEVELRNDRANAAIRKLLYCGIGKTVADILGTYISFVNASNDSNFSRWPIAQWWADFLGDVEVIKLTTRPPDKTIDKVKKYIEKQVSTQIAMIACCEKDDPKRESLYDWMLRLVEIGMGKFKGKHWNLIKHSWKAKELPIYKQLTFGQMEGAIPF